MSPRITSRDLHYMKKALQEAHQAYNLGEVPVGAIIVNTQGQIIARSQNRVETKRCATAHAEMQALLEACEQQQAKYLPHCTLYVTLEPCPMCAMATYWTQLGRLVWGAKDAKRGYRCWNPGLLHPATKLSSGVFAKESSWLLRAFFQPLRQF